MADFGINWNLAQPVDVGGSFLAGIDHGKAARQEAETRSALAAYGTNPSIETANGLIAVNPALGMRAAEAERAKAQEITNRQALVAATQPGQHKSYGDLIAAGVDPEVAAKMEDRHFEDLKRSSEFLGQVALDISNTPEADRPQKWASYVAQARGMGMEVPPEFQTYSPQALNGAAVTGKQVQSIIDNHAPKYTPVPEGATLVNTRDPSAIAQFQGGGGQPTAIRDAAGYDALPPGAQYIDPNGVHRTKGGAPSSAGGATFPLYPPSR
jgi:hypothetical protein